MAEAKVKGSTTSEVANWAQRCDTETKAPGQWEVSRGCQACRKMGPPATSRSLSTHATARLAPLR